MMFGVNYTTKYILRSSSRTRTVLEDEIDRFYSYTILTRKNNIRWED